MGNNMFCIHCGAPIMPTDAFCTKCGKAIELPKKNYCIHCGAVLNSGDAFCIMCGAPVKQQKPEKSGGTKDKPPMQKPEQRCKKCGAVLPLGAKKCVKCGKKVKRKASKGKVVRRVIAAVLVAALLAGLWKRGMMPWELLRTDKTVELQAGQTVQS